jgi:hypothetical protein
MWLYWVLIDVSFSSNHEKVFLKMFLRGRHPFSFKKIPFKELFSIFSIDTSTFKILKSITKLCYNSVFHDIFVYNFKN